MVVNAIVLFNKLFLLPDSHRIQKLLRLSLHLPSDTWVQRVLQLMKDNRLDDRIPLLHDCESLQVELIALATTDTAVRRNRALKIQT